MCDGEHLGPQNDPQMGPKMGPKSKTKKGMKKEALQDRLGAVLGRSWGRLGARLGVKNVLWPQRRSLFSKIAFLEKLRLEDHFGANLGQLGRPKGSKMEPKRGSKTHQKKIRKVKRS